MTSDDDLLSALRMAVKENAGLLRENTALRSQRSESIAIVGMACRLPGGVASPDQLWDVVLGERDVIGDVPDDRGWDPSFFDPEPGRAGRSSVRRGGFVSGAADFDPGFFGIGPREARVMDPQQRQLLEVTHDAFEDAGLDPKALRGSDTGVFVGSFTWDYQPRMSEAPSDIADYLLTTNGGSVLSGRVSYTFGFTGPAVSVDTACSSSLVALHSAAHSLRAGECALAVAGGVTVMATPGMLVGFSRQRGLAPDGRCKSFGAGADGVGLAEGAGVLILERLSDARRNNHRVLAVMRGSAVNQDGASNGLTAPSGPSQQRVIRAALRAADLTADEVDVVEAHGTGTELGDPIEARAIVATYGRRDERDDPVWLGSIKSNMGHTQAAAGVAGVMKMVLAMRHGILPATLHADDPSPHVDWSAGRVGLLNRSRPWPRGDRPRRAAVSSFGLSGTNAHVVLEEAPPEGQPTSPPHAPFARVPWVLSARTDRTLTHQARRLAEFVDGHPEFDAVSIGAALARRSAFEHRAVLFGADRDALREGVGVVAAGDRRGTDLVCGRTVPGATAFVFAGQGAQRLGMGRELYESSDAFAVAWDEVATELDRCLGASAVGSLWGSDSDVLTHTGHVQAGLFALEVALCRMLDSWGVRPDFVIGHSVGEIAAAHVAGVLSLTDAARVVVARGRLMHDLPAGGAMVAVRAPEHEVVSRLRPGVEIAAVNGARAVVLSGVATVVDQVAGELAAAGHTTTRLQVSHAFHSTLMDPMLEGFAQAIAGITPQRGDIALVSTVTGEVVGPQYGDPDHWMRHVRQTVRFDAGLRTLTEAGVTRFVEIGPDGGLSAIIAAAVGEDCVVAPLMRDGRSEAESVLAGAARVAVTSADTTATGMYSGLSTSGVTLPTYSFERQRFWWSSTTGSLGSERDRIDHPMVVTALADPATGGTRLLGRLSPRDRGQWADHVVGDLVVLPGSAMVELAVRAGDQVGCSVLRELVSGAPLVLTDAAVEISVTVSGMTAEGRQVFIHSRSDGETWTEHARGVLDVGDAHPPDWDLVEWPPVDAVGIDAADFYRELSDRGYRYGPTFRGVTSIWRHGDDTFAEVVAPESISSECAEYGLHPALLDAATHPALVDGTERVVPLGWENVRLHARGATRLRVHVHREGRSRIAVRLADATGRPVMTIGCVTARPWSPPTDVSPTTGSTPPTDVMFALRWRPVDLPAPADVVVAGEHDVGAWATADVVVVHCTDAVSDDVAVDAVERTKALLTTVQSWLSTAGSTDSRLLVLTRGAMTPDASGVCDVAGAAVWGLMRAVRAENPGRVVLADVDDDIDPALLIAAQEPELAVRSDRVWAARLARSEVEGHVEPLAGTVVITGGTGGLGAEVARHLVRERGVRHLVLLSRRGRSAPGAAELEGQLTAAGAAVRIESCDVADRSAVAAVLSGVPAHAPLCGIVHAAGVLDDSVVSSLTPDRVDTVFAPKVFGARHLDELTRDQHLDIFVLFTSVSGVLGGPGQGNYAAANACVDAIARARRARGGRATAIAWGPWSDVSGMADRLADRDRHRLKRAGLLELDATRGLTAFDVLSASSHPETVVARFDSESIRRADSVPPLLRELYRPAARLAPPATESSLRDRLADLTEGDRRGVVLEMVCAATAETLGYDVGADIDPHRAFLDLGFDSLGAVEFRNRLRDRTGLALSATTAFDHPTPAAVALLVAGMVGPPEPDPDAELRTAISAIPLDTLREAGLLDRLTELSGLAAPSTPATVARERIAEMDSDALVRMALGGRGSNDQHTERNP